MLDSNISPSSQTLLPSHFPLRLRIFTWASRIEGISSVRKVTADGAAFTPGCKIGCVTLVRLLLHDVLTWKEVITLRSKRCKEQHWGAPTKERFRTTWSISWPKSNHGGECKLSLHKLRGLKTRHSDKWFWANYGETLAIGSFVTCAQYNRQIFLDFDVCHHLPSRVSLKSFKQLHTVNQITLQTCTRDTFSWAWQQTCSRSCRTGTGWSFLEEKII